MGKKYIIELLDECNSEFKGIIAFGLTQEKQIAIELIPKEELTPYTYPEQHAEVTADAYQRGYETAKSECEDCPKQAYTDTLRMDVYLKGLSDSWEAAKRIGKLSEAEKFEIFGEYDMFHIMLRYTPAEAIEKLKAYEQEQEKTKVEYNFDEIKDVLETTAKECNVSLDEIAEVLQKMKEADNG